MRVWPIRQKMRSSDEKMRKTDKFVKEIPVHGTKLSKEYPYHVHHSTKTRRNHSRVLVVYKLLKGKSVLVDHWI